MKNTILTLKAKQFLSAKLYGADTKKYGENPCT
jgi:hypothetical protein